MKNLIKKVKEILTILILDYLQEFLFGVLSKSVKDIERIDSEKNSIQYHKRKLRSLEYFITR